MRLLLLPLLFCFLVPSSSSSSSSSSLSLSHTSLHSNHVEIDSRKDLARTAEGLSDFNVKDYGAVGDGLTLDTIAIEKTLAAADRNGGGRVILPRGGVYLAGALHMRSNVEFYVEEGATLLASPRYGTGRDAALIPGMPQARAGKDRGRGCRLQGHGRRLQGRVL
jgi:polygalacturonase